MILFASLYDMAVGGGPMMLPILLSSILLVTLILERLHAFWPSRTFPRPVVRYYRRLCNGEVPDPKVMRRIRRSSLLGRLLGVAYDLAGRSADEVRRSLEAAAGRELARLRGPTLWLTYLARIGPLLGLLGSILGLIETFAATGSATQEPGQLATGISLALVATFSGVSVALIAETFAHYFRRRADRLVVHLEELLAQLPELAAAWSPDSADTAKVTSPSIPPAVATLGLHLSLPVRANGTP
jgi:biopolymer transport protein ExbB